LARLPKTPHPHEKDLPLGVLRIAGSYMPASDGPHPALQSRNRVMKPEPPAQTDLPAIPDHPASSAGDDAAADGGDRRSGASGRARSKTLSHILTEIAGDTSRDAIAINDLISYLGGRGRAGLILLFALPNVLPAPPGMSGVLGLPLLYLSVQMMLGRMPWLPKFIGERAVPRDRFASLVGSIAPWLGRAERLLRPRWSWAVNHIAERVLGAFCLILAAVLALPIPLGNMLPAFAICLIALGILERDGLWSLAGTVIGFASLGIVAGVVYALVKSSIFLLMNAFT
jgi:hypothetical protein